MTTKHINASTIFGRIKISPSVALSTITGMLLGVLSTLSYCSLYTNNNRKLDITQDQAFGQHATKDVADQFVLDVSRVLRIGVAALIDTHQLEANIKNGQCGTTITPYDDNKWTVELLPYPIPEIGGPTVNVFKNGRTEIVPRY